MRNHCYENDFDLHENETACRTHFNVKGFALRLVLKQRHKRTRKWPIGFEAVDFYILRKSLCSSLNCWQSKFVIELEQNVGKEISTENCLWNSIQYRTLCVFETVSISNFMSFIVKIILLKMQVPKDANFFKFCS